MIAFLHTTSLLLDHFEDLVRKYDKKIEVRHFVNEKLLETATKTGQPDIATFDKAVTTIKALEPDILICTCSTYGAVCDTRSDIKRIDQPVVVHLVNNYQKIGVVYTVKSTKEVTEDLIQNIALACTKDIELYPLDCTEFWTFFEAGDMNAYHQAIASKIRANNTEADVFFLAQASMENAKDYLPDFEKEVLCSPEFGIKTYLEAL